MHDDYDYLGELERKCSAMERRIDLLEQAFDKLLEDVRETNEKFQLIDELDDLQDGINRNILTRLEKLEQVEKIQENVNEDVSYRLAALDGKDNFY